MQLTAAILPYPMHMTGKKWPGAPFTGVGDNPQSAQPWLPSHKEPVKTADKASAAANELCQTVMSLLGVLPGHESA